MLLKKKNSIILNNLNKYANTVNLKIIFKEKVNGLINCDLAHCQSSVIVILKMNLSSIKKVRKERKGRKSTIISNHTF